MVTNLYKWIILHYIKQVLLWWVGGGNSWKNVEKVTQEIIETDILLHLLVGV